MHNIVVVIPNWNGEAGLRNCLDSLLAQTIKARIVMVDNGSVDGSVALVEKFYSNVEIIIHTNNRGYAGGVNPGFKRAIESGATYVAPFNNDAVAEPEWLEKLVNHMESNIDCGIASSKMLSDDGITLDSTGEFYTDWGLPYPRGRGERDISAYDEQTNVFGASGGASLYRVSMLEEIGLFDEDFFAYYEDVDLSFRAQLAGWKVAYVPEAIVYHEMSVTGKRIKGFFTYQTVKNLPWLLIKNVPSPYLVRVLPRFMLALLLFIGRAVIRGHLWYALKALARCFFLLPKKLWQRRRIQLHRKVSVEYIWGIMTHDLPPNAHNLRKLRSIYRKLTGRTAE